MVVLFGATAGALSLVVPVAVQSYVNTMAFTAMQQPIVVLTSVVIGVLAVAGGVSICQLVAVELIQRRIFERIAGYFGRGLPRTRAGIFDHWRSSDISARFLEVATIQKSAAILLVDGTILLLQTLLGMTLLAFYHPTLLAFVVFLLVGIAVVVVGLGRGAERTAIAESMRKYKVFRAIDDIVRNPGLHRNATMAQHAEDHVRETTNDYLKDRHAHFRVLMRQHIGFIALQVIASGALLGIGATLVLQEQLSLGQLVASEIVVAAVVAGTARAGKYLEALYDLLASVAKVGEVLDLETELPREPVPAIAVAPARVEVEAATFAHPGMGKPTINDLSLVIPAGDHVGIFGDHASGKSTFARLLAAQALPQIGCVRIDGIDTREVTAIELRNSVALVSRVEVLSASVLDNIRSGRSGDIAQVRAVVERVGLGAAVDRMAEGLHTQLGAVSSPMSETELLRLMLARAIFARPKLLVVDGVLDGFTERDARTLVETLTTDTPWTLVVLSRSPHVLKAVSKTVALHQSAIPEHTS